MNNKNSNVNIITDNTMPKKVNSQTANGKPDFDYFGIGILVAMALKSFALIPTIAQVAKTGTLEEISIVTPIFYMIAFFILFVVSFMKKYYIPMLLFIVGVITSIILLVQKIIYERSGNANSDIKSDKKSSDARYAEQVKEYEENIKKYEENI